MVAQNTALPSILNSAVVSEDDLIAALFASEPSEANPHGARTMAELMAETGKCRGTIVARLHALHAAGQIGVTKLRRTGMDGRSQPVAAYYRKGQ